MNRLVLQGAGAIATLCAFANAQTVVQTLTGAQASDQMGDSVAIVGDVDGDGRADIGVGAPYADIGGSATGTIRIVSGATGQVLYQRNGLVAGDRLGESIAGAGDVNLDGYADFVAGAPLNDHNGLSSGMARVWSGRDGTVLYTWYGDDSGDWFGAACDSAGDVNNDGWPDVIIGAPYGKSATPGALGEARIFSGRDGSVIRTHNSPQSVALMGASVSGAGDVNRDGWDDLIIGAPQSAYNFQDSGRTWVFSGKTGAALYHWDGVHSGDYFGTAVDGGQDFNNDGWPDLVVGTPFHDYNGGNSGTLSVYSGKTGALLQRYTGTASFDEFGRTAAFAGDVDGDGYADVVGGSKYKDQNFANVGMVRVYSGRTGSALFTVYGSVTDEQMGHFVAGGGDVNGDSLDDVIVGWPTYDTNGSLQDTGRARVWSAAPFAPTSYCTASPNSGNCAAVISSTGTPSMSATSAFTVRATQVINQKTGQFFFGFHGQDTPYYGGHLCVKSPVIRTPASNSGGSTTGVNCSGSLQLNLNAWLQQHAVASAGDTLFGQFFYRDGASTEFSNALYFTVLP